MPFRIVTPRAGASVAQQALALRRVFPASTARLRRSKLMWTGTLNPTPLSRSYTVRINYSLGEFPDVVVLDPPLMPDSAGLLPHVYRGGSLCLHEAHEWDRSMLIADTIVPWTAEWLAHYELWRQTGCWYADSEEPGIPGSATCSPTRA